MKRFLIFTVLFSPLALLVYTSPLVVHEGIPKLDFVAFLIGSAYVLATVPGWIAAATDWILSAKPLYLRIIPTMALAAGLAQLVARYLGDHMDADEVVTVALTGAIPAALCSCLAALRPRKQDREDPRSVIRRGYDI